LPFFHQKSRAFFSLCFFLLLACFLPLNLMALRIRGFFIKVLVELFQKLAGFGAEPHGFSLQYYLAVVIRLYTRMCVVFVVCVFACPSDKAQAVQPGQRNKGIYDTAYHAFHAAKNHRNQVKPKQANQAPVNCAKNN
jgi:hypothetical protein